MTDGNPLVDDTDWQIVRLLADGLTVAKAADKLFLSRPTVDRHLLRLREQLGAKSNAHLVAIALRRGWID